MVIIRVGNGFDHYTQYLHYMREIAATAIAVGIRYSENGKTDLRSAIGYESGDTLPVQMSPHEKTSVIRTSRAFADYSKTAGRYQ